MFDWKAFFDKHNVEWRDSGPNIKSGNLGICCPFCGVFDDNFHMGINLSSPESKWVWSCWKDPSHKGNSPYYLIQKIARCNREQAIRIYDGDFSYKVDLEKLSKSLDIKEQFSYSIPEAFFSKNERLLCEASSLYKPFLYYLKDRGFDDPYEVAENYKLRAALSGKYKSRIIFPFIIRGSLVGWTGRSLVKSKMRYKTYPEDAGIGRKLIYNYEEASKGGEVLFVCEGPFDALKVDYFGKDFGARAVATIGLSMNPYKAAYIREVFVKGKFKSIQFLLDSGAEHIAMDMKSAIIGVSSGVSFVPSGYKDPGEFSRSAVRELVSSL